MKIILAAGAAFAFVMFAGWYSGLDMLERGPRQAAHMLTAAMVACGFGIIASIGKPKDGPK